MRTGSRVLVAAAALLAGACDGSYRALLDRIASKEDVALARRSLDRIRMGQTSALLPDLDPAVFGPELVPRLEEVGRYFPPGEPRSVELIGAHLGSGPGWRTADLSFQYEFDGAWLAANVHLRREGEGPPRVAGVQVQRLPDALQRIHAFTFRGKGAAHWAVAAAALAVVSFVVAVLVAVLRARGLRRRWLWALFVAFGVGGLSLDWTSGALSFRPLSLLLFGAGAVTASPYAPWVVTVSLPLGAVAFVVARLRRRAAPEPAASAAPPP